jgi:uncharacterized protein YkwD
VRAACRPPVVLALPVALVRAAALAVLMAPLTACGPRATVPTAAPTLIPAEHVQLLRLVNEARATARDCGPEEAFPAAAALSLDGRLSVAAQAHAAELRLVGRISHRGLDGSSVGERATRHGYAWSSVGENLAAGFDTPEEVVSAWLGSPDHCATIMDARFVHLGVGRDLTYWTQVFGRPR